MIACGEFTTMICFAANPKARSADFEDPDRKVMSFLPVAPAECAALHGDGSETL